MGYQEMVRQAIDHPHYKAPLGPNQGRGVGERLLVQRRRRSSAQMSVNEDGSVVVMTAGHPDIGGSRASTANIAAELLGVGHGKIQVVIGDTSGIGFSNLTGGGRVTLRLGDGGHAVGREGHQDAVRARGARSGRSSPRR